jgi:chromosome segregation ATPase
MMTDREKTAAEIEARLTQLGQTITTLRRKAEQQRDKYAAPLGESLDAIESKRREVQESLPSMKTLEEDAWSATVGKLSRHLDDIDASLRQALAHFS